MLTDWDLAVGRGGSFNSGKKIFLKPGEGDPLCARLNLLKKEQGAAKSPHPGDR